MQKKILEIIIKSIKEVSALQGYAKGNISEKTELIGAKGIFDSMALVTFITDLEQRIRNELSCNIVIANEEAILKNNSPLKNVRSLVSYISKLLKDN